MTLTPTVPHLVASAHRLSVRAVASRGVEIGGAWFGSVSLPRNGSAADASPDDPRFSSFAPSLVTTSGLDNVGSASEAQRWESTVAR